MALRWCAAGMAEARGQFRRVNGHLHLARLAAELERVTTENGAPDPQNEVVNAA
jgi:putative transposase